uniref:Uncharacterized protein n=1 Tax=Prorocentrum minimum TaxID=39449 RepID=E8Z6P9_PROMN|nr:unknown [Prorocentrum minimum]
MSGAPPACQSRPYQVWGLLSGTAAPSSSQRCSTRRRRTTTRTDAVLQAAGCAGGRVDIYRRADESEGSERPCSVRGYAEPRRRAVERLYIDARVSRPTSRCSATADQRRQRAGRL